MGFPLSFSKSRRAKQPDKGRAARFRALEERALLSAVRVTALDFLTFEGSYSKTGVSDPGRFDWHEVGCGRPSGGHTAACWGSQESYLQDMLSMSAKYADAALAQTNADALAAEKTQNAALRDAAIDGADSAYKVTVRNAWNNSYLSNLESGATAKTDDEALAAAANASLESAVATYRAAAFADYGSALDDLDMIDRIAAYQQERVDRGISVPNDAFADLDDPDFEYQVCFAAGTPVLMADGSTKPIETVRPGDLVLASDHLDPESEPVPARVVRFFDNGLKEVVRVRFEGGTELVCTPGHRFYVAGQGWKHANELALGDACLSADG
ncbi:MAG: hypothetical protein II622_06640, partial [Thermoguttaceae bacterium]|nr:hypothetical protein [Thermoguttaceae bacterium]